MSGYELINGIWVENCHSDDLTPEMRQAQTAHYSQQAQSHLPKDWRLNNIDPDNVKDRIESMFASHRTPARFEVINFGNNFVHLRPISTPSMTSMGIPSQDEIKVGTGCDEVKAGNGNLILWWNDGSKP